MDTREIVTLELPVLVNVTVRSALLASPVLPKFKLPTLAISCDADPAIIGDEDDSAMLQIPSAPAELITPRLSSTATDPC
jgi:hypothetical protein